MSLFANELRVAWRSLLRRPAFLLTCSITLALVLGANASIFAVMNAAILRPLPFAAGERVVQLYMLPPGMSGAHQRNPYQQIDFVRLRERARTMRKVEGYLPVDRVLSDASGPMVVKCAYVSGGLFEMMGASATVGQLFNADAERPGTNVAVVSDGYWQRVMGRSQVLGTAIVIDGVPHTVIGIVRQGFPPPFLEADIFTPLVASPAPAARNPSRSVVTFAELAEDASIAQASAEANAIVQQTARELPSSHAGWTSGAVSAREWQFGTVRTPVLALFWAACLVVLIACANIASLTSAQAVSRSGELALRLALGATARDIIRLQMAEMLIVCLLGAGGGLLLAQLAVPALLAIDPPAVRSLGVVTIDWRVQLFTLMVSIATAVAAALLPAVQTLRGRRGSITNSPRRAGASLSRRSSRILVAAEVALSVALLMAGAVLIAGLRAAAQMPPGFTADGVLTAQVRLPPDTYATTEARAAIVERLLTEIRSLAGVASASTTMNDFIPGNAFQTMFHVEGRLRPDGQPHSTLFRRVSTDYFSTMQITLLRGRAFAASDRLGSPDVAVVSQSFADQLFPGEDAIGKMIRRTGASSPPTTIVGIVADVHDVSLTQLPEPTLYLSWAQNNTAVAPVSLVIRTNVPPENVTASVRAALAGIDPALPLRRVQTLRTFVDGSIAPERFRATVLALVATLGLVLACIGIAGVAYRTVADRSHELAVRMALGSSPSAALGLVMRDAMRDVAAGAVLGTLAGWLLCLALSRAMANVGPIGGVTLAGALGVLGAAAALAALLPAARVLRVQPSDVLKA